MFSTALQTAQIFETAEPRLARSLSALASIQQDRGHFHEAEKLYQRAMTATGAENLSAHIEILNGLAYLYFQTGRYHKSERLTLECLGLEEGRPSPDRVAIARQIANLAAVYQNQRRYAEADEHYLRALKLFETAAGTPPPEIAF